MRVARQIGEHRLWAREWALGVDEPARPLELSTGTAVSPIVGFEFSLVGG